MTSLYKYNTIITVLKKAFFLVKLAPYKKKPCKAQFFGGNKLMKTFMEKPENVERKWYVVDASNMPLGRLASQVADILTGKNKPFSFHIFWFFHKSFH